MHKRTAHRWRLLIIMMSGAFLALGSFWLAQMMDDQSAALGADAFRDEPDYIVEKFSFVRMSPDGQPRYVISGSKLTHRPIDDSADIEQPQVKSVGPGHAPMTIVAKHARVDHGNTQVHLSGDVEVDRKGSATVQPMVMKTQELTVFPDDDTMQSAVEVTMTLGTSFVRGTGMRANNATKQLHFDRNGEMILPPKNVR
jgi:lipopolysaccharide export system protein LptC